MRPAVACAAAVAAVLLLAAAPAAARFGMPEPLTDRGEIVEDIYAKITVAGILVFILVFALLMWVLVRYREGSGHGRATHERHRGSIKAELVWTILPLAVMLWIGVMSYAGLVKLDEGLGAEDHEMEVVVTGFQWSWQMDYGDGVLVTVSPSPDAKGNVAFDDTFHLPADTRVLLNLTGSDVIHAFNIMDANRAYVTMDDANPYGPHKHLRQVHSFPAGKYLIQCKEMCLNPGHAYMRAELIVEPRADFDLWLKERSLRAGSELAQTIDVEAKGGQLTTEGGTDLATGTRVVVRVANDGDAPVTVTGFDGSTLTVQPGAVDLFAFNATRAGNATLTSDDGGRLSFNVIDATPVQVTLGAFELLPETLEVRAGTSYLVQVRNVHNVPHNLYIGSWDGEGDKEVVAQSATIGGGAATSFLWTPAESGTVDMWCDVGGHYAAGMHGDVHIA